MESLQQAVGPLVALSSARYERHRPETTLRVASGAGRLRRTGAAVHKSRLNDEIRGSEDLRGSAVPGEGGPDNRGGRGFGLADSANGG